jgi:hypothetical protein
LVDKGFIHVKRSRSIKLVLLGTLSVGVMSGCGPADLSRAPITSDAVYTNNFYVPGVGYYHAPFRSWYAFPYNHYDPQTRRYFSGGVWSATPCASIMNISAPGAGIASAVEAQRTDVRRSGFGSTSSHYSTWS